MPTKNYKITGLDQLESKFAKLESATQGKVLSNAVRSGANPILNDAIPRTRYRTGNLRRSLHVEVVNESQTHAEAEIGTDVEYAPPQEFGTSRITAQPFLRPAFDTQVETAKKEIAEALKQQIESV